MDKTTARLRIGREMKSAEDTLGAALLAQSDLFSTLLVARRDTDVDPFTGHAELLRLMKSQQELLNAEGQLARVHAGLLGIQETASGIRECPPNEPMGIHEAA